jgi:hypothetical protein
MSNFILGCSPGRCGSATLAALLDMQNGCICSHSCPATGGPKIDLLHILEREIEFTADIAPWWIWRMSQIIEDHPTVKLLIIWRNEEEILDSMRNVNYIEEAPFAALKKDPQSWIRNYYTYCLKVASSIPDNARLCRADFLSNTDYQRQLLLWCGFEDPIINTELHLNSSRKD